jgi:1-phosphatidylinositol-4-phosphate 5-kinase/1-phosphatidylinositol-3-phosphate 5-kinase
MENLLHGIDAEYKVYDLKGSEINRYVSNKERGKVFLDMNYKEDFNAEPISIDKGLYSEIMEALRNDCLVLNKMNVVDYSLMLIIGDDSKSNDRYIKIGIIDYLRKYTWDKKIEEYSKKIANGFVKPTIINPDSYRKRFINEMQKHFIGI